jgi:hypothetical protein
VEGTYARTERPHRAEENALLFSYVAAVRCELDWADRAVSALNDEVDRGRQRSLALYGGLSGFGWIAEHVGRLLTDAFTSTQSEDTANDDEQDIAAEIDAAIVSELRRHPMGTWRAPYDLIGGLVGYGVYFLERLPRPSALEGLRLVLDHLESLAVPVDRGLAWHTRPELIPEWQQGRYPEGSYNCGVAHGIPGVLYLLNEARGVGIEARRVDRLLEGGMDWFLAQRREDSNSWFPSQIRLGHRGEDCRQTWCYGDLGVAAVMLQVVRRSTRRDWHQVTHALLDHCLTRASDLASLEEPTLCHGAAGNAHVFNRIYQSEGDVRCREAALMWFERALGMRRPGAQAGGFLGLRQHLGTATWEASPAFLDGAIGVALALMGAMTTIEPAWDRLLLLSGRVWSHPSA